MKVQVKDKQGIDEAGNKHPAPGIKDGTHECRLKWQWKDTIRGDWSILLGSHLDNKGNPTSFVTDDFPTRQIWVLAEQDDINVAQLAEQEKEAKTAEEVFNDYINIRTVGNEVAQNIIDAMVTYAAQFKDITSSTRIAELEARVAELEGVLKEIEKTCKLIVTNKYIATPYPISKVYKLATNALKNQQPWPEKNIKS